MVKRPFFFDKTPEGTEKIQGEKIKSEPHSDKNDFPRG